MERQLIIPNYHVILVHFPLALLAVGTFIELFAFLWRRSSFRQAGRWMLLMGVLSAIPAATSGLYAARQALSDEEFTSWSGLMNSQKLHGDAWHALRDHFTFNAIAVGVFSLLLVSWLGSSDRIRRRLHPVFLILLLLGMSILTVSAWHGGELVYRYGAGVMTAPAPVASAPTTSPASTTEPSTNPTTMAVAASAGEHHHDATGEGAGQIRKSVERVIPPIQAHLTMAGWVVALSLAALGLSIRQITMAPDPRGEEAKVDQQLADALQPGRALADAPQFNPEYARSSLLGEVEPAPPLVPPARFWLIALLLAVVTAFIGLTLVEIYNISDFRAFLDSSRRATAHAVLGGSIVLLTLILAGVTRWATRSKSAVFLFAALLLLVVAAQVWIGILMLFDGNDGGIRWFN